MGSSKTSAAKYLSSQYGFAYTRYSQVLQEWRSGMALTREQLQKLGWEVMSGGLQKELNTRLIAGIDRSQNTAIDGLRHEIDFRALSSAFDTAFYLIFLEASPKVRFERLRSRFGTLADFQAADAHPVDASIDSLRPFADTIISTDDRVENLHQRLDAWIAAHRPGGA